MNKKNLFQSLQLAALTVSIILFATAEADAGNTELSSKLNKQETQKKQKDNQAVGSGAKAIKTDAAATPEDKPQHKPVSDQEAEETATSEQATNKQATSEQAESEQATNEQAAEQETAEQETQDGAKTSAQADSSIPQQHDLAVEHWELSGYYFRRWDFEMAEAELDLALSNEPHLKIAHRDACIVAILRGQFPRAMAEFMMTTGLGEPLGYPDLKRAEIKQRAAILHYNRGLQFARKDMWKNAIAELELALRLTPNSSTVHHALAFAYANQNNYEEAEKHYRATLQLAPGDSAAHADLAYMMLDMGKKEIAEQEMDEAVRRSPRVVAYHVDLGWLAEKQGNLVKAIHEFQAAVDLSPEHAGLWTHLGGLLEKNGEAELAANAYRHASQIDPSADEPRIGLERLEHGDS